MGRKGEKIGWIGGWFGSFVWLLVFAVLWLVRGRMVLGMVSLLLFCGSLGCIVRLVPWKYPTTPYWKLMLPIYLLFFAGLALTVQALGGFYLLAEMQYGLWILPCLTPLFVLGRRTWRQGEASASDTGPLPPGRSKGA